MQIKAGNAGVMKFIHFNAAVAGRTTKGHRFGCLGGVVQL